MSVSASPPIEQWASLGEAFPGYAVSDRGRVRAGDREVRPFWDKSGLRVNVQDAEGRWSMPLVTVLVATAFVPNPNGWECVRRHDRGKPYNASAENLYWAEWPAEATAPQWVTVKQGLGVRSLTDDQVRDIRTRYAAGGITLKSLAQYYRTSVAVVHAAITRRTYKHVE